MDISQQVTKYLLRSGRLPNVEEVSFLAAGEYNTNYLVRAGGKRYVLRINHGSQLGLEDQIGYEFRVLRAVARSGVTPAPLFVDSTPQGLPGGVLMMDFLPGRPLDYSRDLARAARVFARIHCLARPGGLIRQTAPVADIAMESLGLINRFPDHPRTGLRALLLDYHARVMDLHSRTRLEFAAEPEVVVNTEVNSGNFLVDGARTRLVDWEKAVASVRYQDLGHFMVETTTRWKTDTVLTEDDKLGFLEDYRCEVDALGRYCPGIKRLRRGAEILERTILLRALAWCYMAWYEYTATERAIANTGTLARIEEYLAGADRLLA